MMKINKVIVIGLGGTGSILIQPLARFLQSQKFTGKLLLIDGDTYSMSNMDRQLFNPSMINMNKAAFQAALLANYVPGLKDQIQVLPEYISQLGIEELVDENVVVFNCVDNNAVRKYVEDKCLILNNAIHICCGNELTRGQVQISVRIGGKQVHPSIYAWVPDFANGRDDRSAMSCEEIAMLPSGGQLIIANMMAASLALLKFHQITCNDKERSRYSPFDITWYDCNSGSFDNEGGGLCHFAEYTQGRFAVFAGT